MSGRATGARGLRRRAVRGGMAAALAATGCSRGATAVAVTDGCPPAAAAAAPLDSAMHTPYVTRAGRTLRMDVVWPRTGGPHPAVLLLHGGGWSGGSRAEMHGEMRALARLGYAAAAVEYRLTHAPTDVFPAAVADVRCAVRVLRARREAYRLDAARIGAAGFSAGAHLASMLGAAADAAALDEPCPAGGGADARVQAVIAYAGPQDLRVNGPYTREQAQLVTNFLGAFPGTVPERAALASPIVHAGRGDAPFLLVHGARDPLVPPAHSERMADALQAAGTPATVLALRGVGHAFVGLAASGDDAVRCTATAFLARWLGTAADAAR